MLRSTASTHRNRDRTVPVSVLASLAGIAGFALPLVFMVGLAVAAWTPGSIMVRTGVLSGQAEHTVAYFLAAFVCCLGLRSATGRWLMLGLFTAWAGVLEVGQSAVPGRHAGFTDFLASELGVVAGFVAATMIVGFAARWLAPDAVARAA